MRHLGSSVDDKDSDKHTFSISALKIEKVCFSETLASSERVNTVQKPSRKRHKIIAYVFNLIHVCHVLRPSHLPCFEDPNMRQELGKSTKKSTSLLKCLHCHHG